MATGYKPFGKVKTVVLPLPPSNMTIDEYKSEYGIDLRDFLELKENEVHFKSSASSYLFLLCNPAALIMPAMVFPNDFVPESYVEGSSDASLQLSYHDSDNNSGISIMFVIDKDDAFDIENLRVYQNDY